jgi:hypothetical protein
LGGYAPSHEDERGSGDALAVYHAAGIGFGLEVDFPRQTDVRFGSLADICSATGHVRFAPNSDRESRFPHNVMSALPTKADICGATAYVCFGPKADIVRLLNSTSHAEGESGFAVTIVVETLRGLSVPSAPYR